MTANRRRTAFVLSVLVTLVVVGQSPPASSYNIIKPRFLIILDTSGSMSDSTGTGNDARRW